MNVYYSIARKKASDSNTIQTFNAKLKRKHLNKLFDIRVHIHIKDIEFAQIKSNNLIDSIDSFDVTTFIFLVQNVNIKLKIICNLSDIL